jgi:hypothetical protein
MKKIKIVALAMGILFFAGCGNKSSLNDLPVDVSETNTPSISQNSNVFEGETEKLVAAMNSGKEMKCSYKVGSGEDAFETVVFLSGKKYMAETKTSVNVQKMIFNEEAMYSWMVGQKDGIKLTNECLREMGEGAPSEPGEEAEEFEAQVPDVFNGAMNVKCEETSGIDFSLPTDVKFTDQCQMMKDLSGDMPEGMLDEMPDIFPGE